MITDKKEEEKIQNKEQEAEEILVDKIESNKEEPVTLERIKELLTNNLKWSQIIYEQNRKINSKLFWNSIFNYLKIIIIIIPLIIGFFYLLPEINNFLKTVTIFLGINQKGGVQQELFIENLLKQVPLDQAKQEQIKTLFR